MVRSLRLPVLDLVAIALLVLGTVEVLRGGLWHSGDPALDMVFVVAACLPLLGIRRWPAPMLSVFVAGVILQCVLFTAPQSSVYFLGCMVYVAAVAFYASPRGQVAGVLVMGAALGALFGNDRGPDTIGNVLFVTAVLVISAATGWLARSHRAGRESAEREAEVVRAVSAAAVVEERGRIARDLHDVVAHGVSLMVVQAAAGRSLLGRDPAAAEAAFDTIEESGQQALAELRRMLDVMRGNGVEPAGRPQAGLSSVEGLAEGARSAGSEVVLRVGDRSRVDAGVSVSAYRIVQEALTNVVKHARGAAVAVVVEAEAGDLVVDVRNAAAASSSSRVPGSGYGIAGMRERAALYDGTLDAGPDGPDGSGWRVVARLPLTPTQRPVVGR